LYQEQIPDFLTESGIFFARRRAVDGKTRTIFSFWDGLSKKAADWKNIVSQGNPPG